MADEITSEDEPTGGVLSKKYDQAFFLALAARGKDAWNARRRDPANQDVRVNFAGIDFSEAPKDEIDFSGFEFGDDADFSGCKWRGLKWEEIQKDHEAFAPGRACFNGAAFGCQTSFADARFGDYASFAGAVFGDYIGFARAAFGDQASFGRVAFKGKASFRWAAFRSDSNFTSAAFCDIANFTGAAFGSQTGFNGTAFGYLANFSQAHFKDFVEFTRRTKEQWTEDLEELSDTSKEVRAAVKQRHEEIWKQIDSWPDRFLAISFSNARFDGEASFSDRSFEHSADFTNTRFYYPPEFVAATNASRIDFTGTHIGFVPPGKRPWTKHWTTDSQIPLRLRAFRKIAEDTKSHDLERDLYIEERKAERGVYWRQLSGLDELEKKLKGINVQNNHVWLEWRLQRRARNARWLGLLAKPDKIARLFAHILWIAVMGVYWAVSDYGRSFVRPVVWLVSSGFFFYWSYSEVLAKLMAKAPDTEKYEQAVRMLALGNTVPFVGSLTIDSKVKEFLFCPCRNCRDTLIPPEGYQWLVLGQNLVSITLVFFIGLALRNYFRIK